MPRRIHTAILIALSILLIACSDDDRGAGNPAVPATPPPEAVPPFLLESDVARYEILQPVIDESGNATVFWVKTTGNPWIEPMTTSLRARHYDNATSSWSPAVTVAGQFPAPFYLRQHYARHVLALPGGDIMVSWYEALDGNGVMLARHFSAATATWSDTVTLDQVNGYIYVPELKTDGEGNVFATWMSHDLSLGTFWRTSRFDRGSASWTPAISLHVSQADAPAHLGPNDPFTRVSVDGDGNAFYAWFRVDQGADSVYTGQIHVRRYDRASSQWTDITTVAAGMRTINGWYWLRPFVLTGNDAGDAIVSWLEPLSVDTGMDTKAMRYDHLAGIWTAAVTIESIPEHSVPMDILMDAAGNATVFIAAGDGMTYTSRFDVGNHAWDGEQLLGVSNTWNSTPRPIIDSVGNIWATLFNPDPDGDGGADVEADLYVRYYSATSNTWHDPLLIAPKVVSASVLLAPDDDVRIGYARMLWPPEVQLAYDFHISRFDSATGSWQEPIEVMPATFIDRQANQAGDQLFLWGVNVGAQVALQATLLRAADDSLQTVPVDSNFLTEFFGRGAVLGDDGNALLVWREDPPVGDYSALGHVYARWVNFAP